MADSLQLLQASGSTSVYTEPTAVISRQRGEVTDDDLTSVSGAGSDSSSSEVRMDGEEFLNAHQVVQNITTAYCWHDKVKLCRAIHQMEGLRVTKRMLSVTGLGFLVSDKTLWEVLDVGRQKQVKKI